MDTHIIQKATRQIDRLRNERATVEKLVEVLSGALIEARPSEGNDTAFEVASTGGAFGFDTELTASMALAPGMADHLRGRIRNLDIQIDAATRTIQREVNPL